MSGDARDFNNIDTLVLSGFFPARQGAEKFLANLTEPIG
jgi:hypothetical protein